jgi:hypothetical protein
MGLVGMTEFQHDAMVTNVPLAAIHLYHLISYVTLFIVRKVCKETEGRRESDRESN